MRWLPLLFILVACSDDPTPTLATNVDKDQDFRIQRSGLIIYEGATMSKMEEHCDPAGFGYTLRGCTYWIDDGVCVSLFDGTIEALEHEVAHCIYGPKHKDE